MMKKHMYFLLVSLICLIVSSNLLCQSLIMGTIQFPRDLPSIPGIRIYHSGKIINATPDHENKTLTFSLPRYGQQFKYTILVTRSLDFATTKSDLGTMIDFMRLAAGQDYKMFTLLLVPKCKEPHEREAKLSYTWRIKQDLILNREHKIPDDAIVICLDPQWVDTMSGTSELELPTLFIKSNLEQICGSQSIFYDQLAQIVLTAMDSDIYHNRDTKHNIKQLQNRVLIAAPIA